MKTFIILLPILLAFKTVYSKAIDNSYERIKLNNFSYKFHCSEEKKLCDSYKNNIKFACNTISKTFEIYKPISFEVFVDDLSKYGLQVLASVMDVNYVPLRTSNGKSIPSYIFPQALVKQIKINKQPQYKENDFTMLINNCNSLPKFKNNEIRTLIIHEILHGLGFITSPKVTKLTDNIDEVGESEITFNKNDNYAFNTRMIPSFSKNIMEITKTSEYLDQLGRAKVTSFLPYSIFDKYLVSLKTGEKIFKDIPFYYEEANKVCFPKGSLTLQMMEVNDYYLNKCVKKVSSETQKIVNRIIKDYYFDINTLGIKTYDGEVVPLQTLIGKYLYASSVHHMNSRLNNEYFKRIKEHGYDSDSVKAMLDPNTGRFKKEYILKYYDENYVLYMSDEDDLTVEQMIDELPNNKKHPLIGNGIVKIMITLGWTQKGGKRNNHSHYLDETIKIPDSRTFEVYYKKKYDIEQSNGDTIIEAYDVPLDDDDDKIKKSKRSYLQFA